jgi:hypothetical protein
MYWGIVAPVTVTGTVTAVAILLAGLALGGVRLKARKVAGDGSL